MKNLNNLELRLVTGSQHLYGPESPTQVAANSKEVAAEPSLEIHPLGIGGKKNPIRLVFDVAAGPAINAVIVDLGNRFRLVLNDVDGVDQDEQLPKLPFARAVWKPQPDFKISAASWINSGGSHHPILRKALNGEVMEDFASITGIEILNIDQDSTVSEGRKELRNNEVY